MATDHLTPEQTSALLQLFGYPAPPADEFTAHLRDVVQEFQRDAALNDSGVVNRTTVKHLLSRPLIGYPDERIEVKVFQTAMNARGYRLRVDGVFGSACLAALQDYQGAVAISRTGVVDQETWEALGVDSSVLEGSS